MLEAEPDLPMSCGGTSTTERVLWLSQAVAKASPRLIPAPRPLRLMVHDVDLETIRATTEAQSSFAARIWISIVLEGGALAASPRDRGGGLSAGEPSGDDPDAEPTPWYSLQLDFPTALEIQTNDSNVLIQGPDLNVTVQCEGTFTDRDHDPTMRINVNCLKNGTLPIDIGVTNHATLAMTCCRCPPPNREWIVKPGSTVPLQLIDTRVSFTVTCPQRRAMALPSTGERGCLRHSLVLLQPLLAYFTSFTSVVSQDVDAADVTLDDEQGVATPMTLLISHSEPSAARFHEGVE